MISLKKDTILLWILCAILGSGCAQPKNDYGYISLKPSGTDVRDTLSYVLDMPDSSAVYEIYLCGRLSSTFSSDSLNVKVLITSPSGSIYTENISLPTNYKSLKKSGVNVSRGAGVYDVEWGYRSHITPKEYGQWKMDLLLLNAGARENYIIKGIHSFGAYCKTENEQQK